MSLTFTSRSIQFLQTNSTTEEVLDKAILTPVGTYEGE